MTQEESKPSCLSTLNMLSEYEILILLYNINSWEEELFPVCFFLF